ncbi:hypothetical protein R6Q59_025358 [Mikania micrantha]
MASEIIKQKINSKEEEEAAKVEIWKYVHGFTPMAVVKCAIELGIPDILENHKTPMSLAKLASEIRCPQPSLHRIMRRLRTVSVSVSLTASFKLNYFLYVSLSEFFLCVIWGLNQQFLIHQKVFQETPVGYAQTAVSRLLTSHAKYSMADLVLLGTNPVILAPWHKLSGWVLSNKDLPFDAAHGTDLWGFGAPRA